MSQVEEIVTGIVYHDTLMYKWGFSKKLKPGCKSLFYGPPGTGKTLVACLIGKRCNLDVYRIDLSTIVSKYIGETEKNLEKIFQMAENRQWILFFDEADALFGKRTGVSSSHDRYANQETAYLLQRIEDFKGVVILASNLKSNIDEAFSRRFQSVIYFPVPQANERLKLWNQSFAQPTVLEDGFDTKHFAKKYELTGGMILNVIRYCSLMALKRNENIIRTIDAENGIQKEMMKEGRLM
jgi:SpoVK/Ycf46/Vps4 family AAA+-type ATPase